MASWNRVAARPVKCFFQTSRAYDSQIYGIDSKVNMRKRHNRNGNDTFTQNHGVAGVVYVLDNPGLREGWHKIGCSRRSGAARANDLNIEATTGTPGAFRCVFECRTKDCGRAEVQVFKLLSGERRGKWGQEYFEISVEQAKAAITQVCLAVDEDVALHARELAKAVAVGPAPIVHTPNQITPVTPVTPATANSESTKQSVNSKFGRFARVIVIVGIIPLSLWLTSGSRTKTLAQPMITTSPAVPSYLLSKAAPIGKSSEVSAKESPKFQRISELPVVADVDLQQRTSSTSAPEPRQSGESPSVNQVSSRPNLSALAREERQSIEAVCSDDGYRNGPAAYNSCVATQAAVLENGTRRPDLSNLSRSEKQSIEAVCMREKYRNGPNAYNQCLSMHLATLR